MNPLLYLDLLSPKKEITLGNEYSSYRTQLGALFSIVAIIITIINTKDIYQSYVNMEIPKETVNYSLDTSKYIYKSKEFPVLFGYISADLLPFKIRIVKKEYLKNVEINLSQISISEIGRDNSFTQNFNTLKLCNRTEIELMIEEYKKKYPNQYKFEKSYWRQYLKISENSFCIDDHELYLYTGLDLNYKGNLIAIKFKNDQNKIYEKEEKDEKLTKYFGVIYYPKYYFTMGNKEQPYIKTLEVEGFPLSSTGTLIIDLFIQKLIVKRDISDIFRTNIVDYEFTTIKRRRPK